MRFLLAIFVMLSTAPGFAADAIVKDGDTLQIAGVIYRLEGIDAPEFDQMCTDPYAAPWSCGVEARDQLAKLIAGHAVSCIDQGLDKITNKWRAGICRVDGAADSLNQLMVRAGFALNLEPDASGFGDDQSRAKADHQGLWQGCFAAPQAFRHGDKSAPLLGWSCPSDKDRELRQVLFPDELAMPPGCAVKAKFARRAHFTGHVGIYQLQGCPSYASLLKPDRWFCSAEDARAAGFRRAFNCFAAARRRP